MNELMEGQTGLLAEVQETEKFCQHLLQLAEDDGFRQGPKLSSHHHVIQGFSYRRLVKEIVRVGEKEVTGRYLGGCPQLARNSPVTYL